MRRLLHKPESKSDAVKRRVLFSGESCTTRFDAWQAPKLLLPASTSISTSTSVDADAEAEAMMRERARLALSCATVNTVYELEQRGARVFDEQELGRLLTDEVGVSTLVEAAEVDEDALMALGEDELLRRYEKMFSTIPLELSSTQQLAQALIKRYRRDLARATNIRNEMLRRELFCRGLATAGTRKQLEQRLREQLRLEASIHESETAMLKDLAHEVDGMSGDECRRALEEVDRELLEERLQMLGVLSTPLPTTTTTTNNNNNRLRQLRFRLELHRHVRERAELLESPIRSSALEPAELLEELRTRRISTTDVASAASLTARLDDALQHELERAPVRIPFGLRRVTADDLESLEGFELLELVAHFDIDVDHFDFMDSFDREELHERILSTLERRRYSNCCRVIRSHLDAFEEPDEHEPTSYADAVATDPADVFLELFERLERCLERKYDGDAEQLRKRCCR